MIKLIACDMDGTLLNDKKVLDYEIYDIIQRLGKKNIIFAAASGRQFCSLNRFFEPVKDDIVYIAENGTFVLYKGKELYSSPMDKSLVTDIVKEIKKIKNTDIILCGKYCAYSDSDKVIKLMSADIFKYNIKKVDSLFDVDDEILKVSTVDMVDVKGNSFKNLYPIFRDSTEVTLSGFNCMDFMNKGVSKGSAIKIIQKKLGTKFEETVAFGDNYNDVQMFGEAYYSFAMKNAEDGVKKKARFIAGHNNENGVIKKIKELCFNFK